MLNNVFSETYLIEQYHSEFFNLINFYTNIYRNSVFCRYLNINKKESIFNINSEDTYTRFHSGLKYDIFDYTPLYYTGQIVNDHADQQDLIGQMIQGNGTVTVYTIKDVSVDDLIIFSYTPQKEYEIFRVSSFRLIVNSKFANPSVNWYELTIEYAPIIDYEKLNILNHYVYDLVLQKNLFLEDFIRTVKETEKFEIEFKNLNSYYDKYTNLYYYIDKHNRKIAPLKQNRKIYNFLSTIKGYQNHFSYILSPYGVKTYNNNINFIDVTGRAKIIQDFTDDYNPILSNYRYSIDQNDIICIDQNYYNNIIILKYTNNINIFDICALIDKWIWYQDYLKYPLQYIPEQTNSLYQNGSIFK